MSSPTDSTPALVQFLDNFLQERNIKWLLATGVAILLGSSAMLVTSHWDSLGHAWKYLILVGYVGIVHAAGQWTYHQLSLRKTGTVLMASTVLLLPLSFITWHLFVMGNWLSPGVDAVVYPAAWLLLGVNIVFAAVAADRIFQHFLNGRQTTFLVSYLALAVAGAVAPTVGNSMGIAASAAVALALWAVFLIGSVKVNRHVFWLVESHQAPRIYGFFPVMLLGAQYLGLFAANFAGPMPTDWLGLALILFAVPVLLTADTVAKVFQQRTGELVRQLPWAVAVPLSIGLLTCGAGMVLAASPLMAHELPFALVPAALLSGLVMGLVANRTGHCTFAWIMIACLVLAYNFSPVFFSSLAKQLAQSGASLVNESRLPYAFYGLTYLPLLIGLTSAACWAHRRCAQVFAGPLRHASIGLPLLLVAASFTQPSLGLYPVFLVRSVMSLLFAAQTRLYRDRRLAIGAIGCLLLAAVSCSPFINQVFSLGLTPLVSLLTVQAVATGLTVLGPRIDRWLVRLDANPIAGQGRPIQLDTICQSSGLLTSVGAAAAWLMMAFGQPAEVMHLCAAATWIGLLLLYHCLSRVHDVLSGLLYGFSVGVGAYLAVTWQLTVAECLSGLTLIWLLQWGLDYVLAYRPESRFALAFATTNRVTASVGLTALLFCYVLPNNLHSLLAKAALVDGWASGVLTLWAFDAARRWRLPAMSYAGYLFGLVFVTAAAIVQFRWDLFWLPAIWTAIPVATLPFIHWLSARRYEMEGRIELKGQYDACLALLLPLRQMAEVLLIGVGSLAVLGPFWSCRVAGVLAIIGLTRLGRLDGKVWYWTAAAALATWHLVTLAVQWVPVDHLLAYARTAPGLLFATIAAASCMALLAWQRISWPGGETSHTIAQLQCCLLRIVSWGSLIGVLLATSSAGGAVGGPLEIALAVVAFAFLVTTECYVAAVQQQTVQAWTTIGMGLVAVAYLLLALSLRLSHPATGIIILLCGLLCESLSRGIDVTKPIGLFRTPLAQTGMTLPAIAAACGAYSTTHPLFSPYASLAMLSAAGFYFWKAMAFEVTRHTRVALCSLSAVIVNLTFWIAAWQLEWTDPQLYLIPTGATVLFFVECLRRDLPLQLSNTLRYVGALCILVSPTFEIIGGSWVHMLTLLVAAVLLVLVSIGVRAKALLYIGTGFLAADLVAMVVRGCWDRPGTLWLAGILLGAAVLILAALAENGRERLLQRMRVLSNRMDAWN